MSLSQSYILFTNPVHAAVPKAATNSNNAIQVSASHGGHTDSDSYCHQDDKSQWRLLSTSEIQRLLTIHTPGCG